MKRRRVKRNQRTRGSRGYVGAARDDLFDRESVSAVSNGPVTFEIALGRAWGMSARVMRSMWKAIEPIVNRATGAAVRAHPERWRRERATGQLVFVGETPRHENLSSAPFTRDQKKRGELVPLHRWNKGHRR